MTTKPNISNEEILSKIDQVLGNQLSRNVFFDWAKILIPIFAMAIAGITAVNNLQSELMVERATNNEQERRLDLMWKIIESRGEAISDIRHMRQDILRIDKNTEELNKKFDEELRRNLRK